jgi:Mg2+-importing ATPase
MKEFPGAFWSFSGQELLAPLETTFQGLTRNEARRRLEQDGANRLKASRRSTSLSLFLAQFKSPIILILIAAAILSFALHDAADALIILAIVFMSGLLGFWQERGASRAVEKLLAMVQVKATVFRDGVPEEIPQEEIVPGDVVVLKAGDTIPGDCAILEARDLFVDEAALTGETFPAEKTQGKHPAETPMASRANALFLGTHVVSGQARAVVVRTGRTTEFGKISERVKLRPPETEFERGVKRFGYLLMEVTLLLVISIFAVNVFLKRPVLDSFLFALALAVGLTPQLLPAIISINLSHGARRMARQKVIVKKLSAIENFGSMNVLCSDKTGTLTEGTVQVHSALDAEGRESERVLFHAYLNAYYETGFLNPIDEAIRTHRLFEASSYRKLDEVPYDFIRKRLSILVAKGDTHLMVTKGALPNVLSVCSRVETAEDSAEDIHLYEEKIRNRFETLSRQGFRVLGISCRDMGSERSIQKDQEKDMTFLGFLVLFDPPKAGVSETIKKLRQLGVSLKIVTGDNRWVAAAVSQQVGGRAPQLLTGGDLRNMSEEALARRVNEVDVFAEVEPNQKERVLRALQKAGNVLGYMGDGINDVPALHAADVSISVDRAVDVAKDTADIVLLEKDLGVLLEGIREGRRTFANTLKYVFMATSANFGNMFSMAGASLFLPFLPLLPKQILLTNLLTDFPEMTIAMDRVDAEMVEQPRRWNLAFIRKFMLTFGVLSSVFDYLTFGVLLFILQATPEQFRTGWFLESVISASLVVLVIRTRRPLFKSKPGKALTWATLLIIAATLIFPYTPLAILFEFHLLPSSFFLWIGGILLLYVFSAESVKNHFYRGMATGKLKNS